MKSNTSRTEVEATLTICQRLQKLGYTRERRIRLYGEEFYLTSNPVSEGGGFAVEGISRKSGEARRIRIPLPVVHTVTREVMVRERIAIAA